MYYQPIKFRRTKYISSTCNDNALKNEQKKKTEKKKTGGMTRHSCRSSYRQGSINGASPTSYTNRSTNRRSTNQFIHQRTDQATKGQVNQPLVNQPISQPTNQPASLSKASIHYADYDHIQSQQRISPAQPMPAIVIKYVHKKNAPHIRPPVPPPVTRDDVTKSLVTRDGVTWWPGGRDGSQQEKNRSTINQK